MDAQPAELLALAESIAREAGEMLRDAVDRPREAVETKSSATDMVTEVDRASEELIAARLREARPDDGLLGEEGASVEGTSGYRWVVDPIDGTTNFLYGHTGFAVSIAVEHEGESVAGAVLDVMAGELFSASKGGGATRNGEPIAASGEREVSKALVATGFGFSPEHRGLQGEVVARLLPRIRDIRRMGAASVDLCSLACGRVDGYFERGLNRWDVAAGGLIATEAGAILGSIEGGPPEPRSMVGGAPGVFEELRSLVAEAEEKAEAGG